MLSAKKVESKESANACEHGKVHSHLAVSQWERQGEKLDFNLGQFLTTQAFQSRRPHGEEEEEGSKQLLRHDSLLRY